MCPIDERTITTHKSDFRSGSEGEIDARVALRECCLYHAPAIILNVEAAAVCYHARLASLSSESISLEVAGETRALSKGTRCCVSFVHRGDSHAFFSNVVEYQQNPPPQLSHLVLEIPSQIVGIEARMAFRVPVEWKSKLSVRMTPKSGRAATPRAIDLSLAGILIEFTEQNDPNLPIGTETEIELRSGTDSVRLKAEVRRRVGRQYGLFFPEVVTRQGMVPPEPLKKIVTTLERHWLKGRIPGSAADSRTEALGPGEKTDSPVE